MNTLNKLRSWIDSTMSMYLVMILALFLLWGVALTMSLVGALAFRPLEVGASFAVFMGVCLGSNYLLGYLFDVKAHQISALITGGILFCIFSPSAAPRTILMYAFVAVVAMASKYLLVWRGRHIFNPAAIAAVIVLCAGLGSASWWIADSSFAVPVTLLALIVLYKTERLQFAGVFLLSYGAALVVAAVASHVPVGAALNASLMVWFPAFFVGFMLSEPQTLPGRHYQRLIVGGAVGFLIGFHPTLGALFVTPEIALVAGNIIALLLSRRVGIQLTLLRREKYPGGQELFEFQPSRQLSFAAGQYMEVAVPHAKADLRGERRMFTIASAPESSTVKIITRYADASSSFKKHLQTIKKGQKLSATAIRGDFLLPQDPAKKLLFIAGGIGITPFRSQLESLGLRGDQRNITLIHAVRSADEVILKDILYPEKYRLRTIILAPDVKKTTKKIINAPRLTPELLGHLVPDIAERAVYISGSPLMVSSLRKAAEQRGATTIKTDSFMGY